MDRKNRIQIMKAIGKSKMKTKPSILVMAIGLFLSSSLFAQEQDNHQGGLFGRENAVEITETRGLMNRSVATGNLNNQAFGQDVPLGSGLLILLGATVGYAIIKKKEDRL